jgi:hypothetical protein
MPVKGACVPSAVDAFGMEKWNGGILDGWVLKNSTRFLATHHEDWHHDRTQIKIKPMDCG